MPHKPSVVASFTPKGEIHVFDYIRHPSVPVNKEVKPEIKFIGHQKEGYGLSWSE